MNHNGIMSRGMRSATATTKDATAAVGIPVFQGATRRMRRNRAIIARSSPYKAKYDNSPLVTNILDFKGLNRRIWRVMRITAELTDESVLEELGARLASARLGRNLTQAALADQAGVSKRTLERLESGAVATQLSSFLRVCRVLGLVEHFESLVPAAVASPMEQLKRQGGKRQRASGKKAGPTKPGKWTWGDES